jgi:two-component system CheB/CheR fusion protein
MPQHRSLQTRVVRPNSSRRTPAARSPPRSADDFAVVGIGASAGGLEACSKLMDGVPASNGMAFILVQHLDPTHESMMVDLLAGHTSMTVRQATDGMPLEPDHLYVIPPGTYLSISDGALRLSLPQAPHGARLPFDFLLHSLAEEYGGRAVAVILSGTGADGTLGLKAVKENGGLVIAQEPDEAGFDGMPLSAIATGAVDFVLPVAKIPDALITYDRRMTLTRTKNGSRAKDGVPEWLPEIIELLHTTTGHDFTLYKAGTLQRRIERRMAMAAIKTDGMERYLEVLRSSPDELELLASDLLINVTSFFRDRQAFDLLAEQIVPDLVRRQPFDQSLRIWIAGCSTGEETYSLAMLFREAISVAKSNVKLQVFASDIDPDAVTSAREGFYPEAIEAEVSPERLARFFSREEHGYRVLPELRADVVFTVQDVLADPPFSRLDLVSCRNLLIYLRPEAQARVLSAFHFALREGGILLLGSSETVDTSDGRFEVISKTERIFRHVGRSRPGELGFSMSGGDGVHVPARPGQSAAGSHQVALAELCRRLVLEAYAPAAVLINRRHECLFSLGPIDRYLRVAPGSPTFDLLAMVRPESRNKLRLAIKRAVQENTRVVVANGRTNDDDSRASFSIDVRPVLNDGEELLLIGFVDQPKQARKPDGPAAPADIAQVAELEKEIETAKTDLAAAIRELESSSEEQKAVNEEALSVNEEFQSANEELLTSKEELQSLNEELTALNGQLQETLERQRTTSNDLQNVLYSTDVATLFLDPDLNIRFFTPATRLLFNILPGDIGRPLADISSQTSDGALSEDAGTVLRTSAPLDREIQAKTGAWYIRRILPYRNQLGAVEGVVVTFVDITERRRVRNALEAAEHQAQLATAAKSRFLAAASHDLRQPLQTLVLLQGQLAKIVAGEKAQNLIARLDDTIGTMSGMLNALLDINQIEAGTIRAEVVQFPVNDLLARMQDEFTASAQAQGLALRIVACSLSVRSDPRLLEQMVRNLLSNALKYTRRGKVLLGCRRHEGSLAIEVCDTGDGIPAGELNAIFEEYHQLDNAARERSRGLGLGLSIVRRLAGLLGHQVHVRSQLGKGSTFAIEVPRLPNEVAPPLAGDRPSTVEKALGTGAILVVEDDPEMRDLLDHLLTDEGYRVVAAPDGIAALDSVMLQAARPDLVLADYNLPRGMNGLQVAAKLCERFSSQIPVIILTGDISTQTLREIAGQHCVQLNKPVKLHELTETIQELLRSSQSATPPAAQVNAEARGNPGASTIFVVDDDDQLRDAVRSVLEDDGQTVEDYPSCEAFLAAYRPGRDACLLIDAYLPGMSGLELLKRLPDVDHRLPAIMMTGYSDVPIAVQAMKAGAFDFIEKPIGGRQLLATIQRALDQTRDTTKLSAWREEAAEHIARLTARQRQIMDLVLAGQPSKNIAADLGISQRTVENHRAEIMKRTGSKSLPALARLAVAASRQ